MGTDIVGKLAKPLGAAVVNISSIAAKPSRSMIDGALGEALRGNFEPVVEEPIPYRLREMIEKIRYEEQQQRGRKP